MPESVARECYEETSAEVSVGRLLHIAEVFTPRNAGLRHRVEALFACEVAASYTPRIGPKPDRAQIDTVWASPTRQAAFFRPAFAPYLVDDAAPFYLGTFDG